MCRGGRGCGGGGVSVALGRSNLGMNPRFSTSVGTIKMGVNKASLTKKQKTKKSKKG